LSFFVLCCVCLVTAQPRPPTSLPPSFLTWMVTSVTEVGKPLPILAKGQLIAFDSRQRFSCRSLQQNLVRDTPQRPVDYCNFTLGVRYRINDASVAAPPTEPCAEIANMTLPADIPRYPEQFLQLARYLGQNIVNNKLCNHFNARPVVINGSQYQMDVWTTVQEGYPCQVSMQMVASPFMTTWAFDGFSEMVPANVSCTSAVIQCAQINWKCLPTPSATDQKLIAALSWVCNPQILDCRPIQPGGPHFIPDTPRDHCNWAFNQYFIKNKLQQGYGACFF